MSRTAVQLQQLDEALVDPLVAAAAADTKPDDVFPPPAGAATWDAPTAAAYHDYLLERTGGLDGPHAEANFVVIRKGAPVGCVRLARQTDGSFELGLWLTRAARGAHVGTAALNGVLAEAPSLGVERVVAHTSTDNPPAVAALRRAGAELRQRADGSVTATFEPLDPPA